jgi:hypothetical protein
MHQADVWQPRYCLAFLKFHLQSCVGFYTTFQGFVFQYKPLYLPALFGNLSTRRGELLQATHEFETVQNHHRQLAADVDHLNRVKVAMETSVSELTDRLANKSTDFKRKSVQVNELASKIDSLSLSVRSLATQESGTKATNGTGISGVGSLGSDVSATSLSGEENGQRSTKPSLQGPHWGQEQLHRMIDRMDEIDRLAEDGLA